jgi:hypothetical protein
VSMLSLGLGIQCFPRSNSCGQQHLLDFYMILEAPVAVSQRGSCISYSPHGVREAALRNRCAHSCRHAMTWDPVNLGDLQNAVAMKKLNPHELVTMKALRDAGVASKKIDHGVKLLAKVWEPCLPSVYLTLPVQLLSLPESRAISGPVGTW